MFGFSKRRIEKAERARTAMKAAFADAEARHDTRAQHDRWPALRDATTAALRVEVRS